MKKKSLFLLTCILLLLVVGCTSEKKSDMKVFYVNKEGNALSSKSYAKMDVSAVLDKIKSLSVISQDVIIEHYKIDNSKLELYFNEAYLNMSKSREVLARAAIVQSLVQCDGVQFVMFYVNDAPLKDRNGNTIGMMRAEDFVQSPSSSVVTYLFTDLTLYYADKEGKMLKATEKTNLRYSANTSIERLVVEQLMKRSGSSDLRSTLPKSTIILGVSVKEGICYVNFDSKFLQEGYDLDPEVTIYSIVNSIIANGNVNKVQILIDGASDVVYQNRVDLSSPLEWKENLIKETKKK